MNSHLASSEKNVFDNHSSKTMVLSEVFPPQNGGSGRWLWEVYKRQTPGDFLMVVGDASGADPRDRDYPQAIQRRSLSMQSRAISSLSSVKDYYRQFSLIRRIAKREKIKMIHAARPLSEGLVARAVKLATGIPYWCYVHGEDVNVAKSSRELRALTRSVLAGSQRVIANSSFTKDLLRQDWMVSEDKILLMNPGVDTKQYSPSDGETDRPAEWRGKTVLLTAGRLQERKGHDTVIRAIPTLLPQFPDLLYVIVGGGDRLEYLKQLASESQVSDHVVFVGEIDDDELLRYFQHCDVFVLANRQVGYDVEGFGIVLIEAQACGKPVIAGASGGTRDTMVRGRTGFLANCEDPKELCKIISEELDTAEKRVQIGERARKHMVENFDWQVLGRIAADHFNSDVSLAGRTTPNSL